MTSLKVDQLSGDLLDQRAPSPPYLPDVHPALARQYRWRFESLARVGLKVNLYRSWEVEGLTQAIAAVDLRDCPLECVMVGDSYFTTHLGRSSTRLPSADRAPALDLLTALVLEVRRELAAWPVRHRVPFLVGDLPDGAAADVTGMLRASERFLTAGADAVKVEAMNTEALRIVDAAARRKIPVVVHLGYSPQGGQLSRHGDTVSSARRLFGLARRARDAGACALVLEMVSEPVNCALSAPRATALPVYSIFSGKAPYGGQSLNVWDAVFKRPKSTRYFPPTATLDSSADRHAYTPELIGERMRALLRLTLSGAFPISPPTAMTEDEAELVGSSDPWREDG